MQYSTRLKKTLHLSTWHAGCRSLYQVQAVHNILGRRPLGRRDMPCSRHDGSQLGGAIEQNGPWLLSSLVLLQDNLWVGAQLVERSPAGAHEVHDEAIRIDVHLLVISLVSHNLGRHVAIAANPARHRVAVALPSHQPTDAKISHLDLQMLGQQQIQWLQISMDHVTVVQEAQRPADSRTPLNNLRERGAPDRRIMLLALGHEVAFQVTTRQELRHAHDRHARLDASPKEHDKIRMPKRRQEIDLVQELV
mmetsp:Transcript_102549/g.142943  ORF Transcript_102549/g.142943 Transcript_102549/m.142943 type:complete len:250 (+) Transcript_102549:460-1209(+)